MFEDDETYEDDPGYDDGYGDDDGEDEEASYDLFCPFCDAGPEALEEVEDALFRCHACGEYFDDLDTFESFDPSSHHRTQLRDDDDDTE